MASLNLNEGSSGGGSEQDTLAPLPPTSNPWPLGGQPFPYPPFPSAPPSFPPGYSDPCHSFHSGSAGSQHSEGEQWEVGARRAFEFSISLSLINVIIWLNMQHDIIPKVFQTYDVSINKCLTRANVSFSGSLGRKLTLDCIFLKEICVF